MIIHNLFYKLPILVAQAGEEVVWTGDTTYAQPELSGVYVSAITIGDVVYNATQPVSALFPIICNIV